MLLTEWQAVSSISTRYPGYHNQFGGLASGDAASYDFTGVKKVGNILAGNYYSSGLTFFCRTELKLEKASSIPFRFRLGSVAYTDYLEGKPNALRP